MKTIITKTAMIVAALALAGCSGGEDDASSVYGAAATQEVASAPENTEDDSLLSSVTSSNDEEGEEQVTDPAADPVRAAGGNFGDCTRMFPGGQAPRIASKEYAAVMQPTYKELCYRAFAIGHSGRTRTALWSAEVLTDSSVEMARGVSRVDNFQEDEALPQEHRSQLTDYRGSGYDRGHLAPSADMPTRAAQTESFLLSNIVPQNGKMNGGVWRDLESDVRKEAMKRKVYIVSGPLFQGARETLKKRVLVPTAMYKAMFAVGKGAVVFVVSNDDTARVQTLSINQFVSIYGLDPFPGLTGPVRGHNIALGPLPNAGITAAQSGEGGSESNNSATTKCKGVRMARAEGTHSWYNEEMFRDVYKRSPKASEWENCSA